MRRKEPTDDRCSSEMISTTHDLSDQEVARANNEQAVGLDVETSGLDELSDQLLLVQVGFRNGDSVLVKSTNWANTPNLKRILSEPAVTKIVTAGAWDTSFLVRAGFQLESLACTKVMVKLIEGPNATEHRLAPILDKYLDIQITKDHGPGPWDTHELSQMMLEGASSDVAYLVLLWERLLCELRERSHHQGIDLVELASKVSNQLPQISALRQLGFNVDKKRLGEIYDF